MMDLYQIPTHLRNFYYRQLVDSKKRENEQIEKSHNSQKSSKVRIHK
jgi:hypothetical protein